MAALAITNPTLADLAKVTDPDGSIADVVEILNATNEILTDMSWQEGMEIVGKTWVKKAAPKKKTKKSGNSAT